MVSEECCASVSFEIGCKNPTRRADAPTLLLIPPYSWQSVIFATPSGHSASFGAKASPSSSYSPHRQCPQHPFRRSCWCTVSSMRTPSHHSLITRCRERGCALRLPLKSPAAGAMQPHSRLGSPAEPMAYRGVASQRGAALGTRVVPSPARARRAYICMIGSRHP
jgi:hypothetical protein